MLAWTTAGGAVYGYFCRGALADDPRPKTNVYNILWVLVFGFATLNIFNLGTRHFEPGKNRLSFGEMIAILVVVVSIFLLGWEMLYLFKVFPLKLR